MLFKKRNEMNQSIDQAYGHFGSAIRDNDRDTKIAMGKAYHVGTCDCYDCKGESE